jgi:hypothetical protein
VNISASSYDAVWGARLSVRLVTSAVLAAKAAATAPADDPR